MALRKIGKYYHVYWKENGKVRSLATGCTDKAEAVKFDQQKKAELAIARAERYKLAFCGDTATQNQTPQLTLPPPEETHKHKRGTLRLDAMFETALNYRKLSETHKKTVCSLCPGSREEFC